MSQVKDFMKFVGLLLLGFTVIIVWFLMVAYALSKVVPILFH